jgi:hypothetical protein
MKILSRYVEAIQAIDEVLLSDISKMSPWLTDEEVFSVVVMLQAALVNMKAALQSLLYDEREVVNYELTEKGYQAIK